MKMLFTRYHYYNDKSRTKEDIRDIGRILNIFKSDSISMSDDGILITWEKAYNNEKVITDINNIARALEIIKGTCFNWRNV